MRSGLSRDTEKLTAAYRGNYIAKRIIDGPSEDATREWYTLSVPSMGEEDLRQLKKLEAKHSVKQEITDAILENLPDRGLKEYSFSNGQANRLNVGVGLIGEIGYDLLSSMPSHSRTCHVLKLAFYFEYGLNNIAKGNESTIRSVIPNPQNATEATINPYLNTINSPNRTVPFFAGAKITYMIGGSRTARAGFHHGCMCYN